jgi:hypothetical protein
MSSFSVDVNEANGRQGILEIEEKEIVTPSYIPTKTEFNYLQKSPHVEKRDYNKIKAGELVVWLDNEQMFRLINEDDYYNETKYRMRAALKEMDTPVKLLHYNFYTDVNALDAISLNLLLELQEDVGVDVIEIPNLYLDWNYSRAIEKAVAWKKEKKIEKSLLGVACKINDIDLLLSKKDAMIGVGVNLNRFKKPLLYNIREKLKNQEIWVHAFSAPREYNAVDKQGTLGILINFFGVDSVSTRVLNWKAMRGYMASLPDKTETDFIDMANGTRYFSPTDYSTHTFGFLESQFGEKKKLSEFCNCPVCQKYTIAEILSDHMSTYAHTRSHQAISYHREAEIYQDKLKNNESTEYLATKKFAKRITE